MKVARLFRACWGALLLASSSARAAPAPGDAPAASPPPPSLSTQAEPVTAPPAPGEVEQTSLAAADAAFRRANLLLDQGAHAEALAELERAYELSPAYQVLYNIGGANVVLGRWASARRAYDQYLKLGGGALSAERRAKVQQWLEELSRKTATLTVLLNVPAVVHVDGAPFESTEVTGLILDPGEHVVRVTKPGFEPLERVVRVTDGANVHLVLPLARVTDEPPLPAQSPFATAQPTRLELPASGANERSVLWISWTVTGALAAGWLTTAGLAIKARHDRNVIERPETSRDRIDDARRLHETLAVVSDVLLASTLASAGVSAYLTWWPPPALGARAGSTRPRGAANGFGIGLSGPLGATW